MQAAQIFGFYSSVFYIFTYTQKNYTPYLGKYIYFKKNCVVKVFLFIIVQRSDLLLTVGGG